MEKYYVNRNAQNNEDHEVHIDGCSHLPSVLNIVYLGQFSNCMEAVEKAREHYTQVNGCYYCCKKCHTG